MFFVFFRLFLVLVFCFLDLFLFVVEGRFVVFVFIVRLVLFRERLFSVRYWFWSCEGLFRKKIGECFVFVLLKV